MRLAAITHEVQPAIVSSPGAVAEEVTKEHAPAIVTKRALGRGIQRW